MSTISLILVFLFSISSAPSTLSSLIGSRSLLRAVVTDAGDYGVELNATNFDSVLKDTPATFAVVEFFAHWCPACRNYKPQYEKVARLFNGPEAVHPGLLLMTRVDCALKINNELCEKFSVSHYPMLFWGPPSKFVGGGWKPKQDKSDICHIESVDARTADRLLKWINKKMGSSYGLEDRRFENEHLLSNVSDPEQILRAVYDVEEATSTAFDIIFQNKMIKLETRASLISFLQLLVAHHPSRRCRKGSAEFLVNFDELYPQASWSVDEEEMNAVNKKGPIANFQICGKEVPRGYWMFCRGSRNETRGFRVEVHTYPTFRFNLESRVMSYDISGISRYGLSGWLAFCCGLWVLMHSLSVRVEDGESHQAFTAICEFVRNFFICEECRQHFSDMCSSVSTPFNNTRDFVLWLWTAHNKVNERLMKEEESAETGDPKFPKTIWPSKQLCPSCQKKDATSPTNWNKDEVFKFLTNYYGKKLVSLHKDKSLIEDVGSDKAHAEDLTVSTSAVVVPVGAALAIAIASCAFGALACFWRSQQKNRKYSHHPHYYKKAAEKLELRLGSGMAVNLKDSATEL